MMRFLIRYADESIEPPCDMAVRGVYTYHDVRNTDDPAKIPYFAGDEERIQREWYGQGTNHRVEHGQIVRDRTDQPCWFVEIASMEQLVAFARNVGRVCIECDPMSDDPQIIFSKDW